jgi:hypothetical protein
VSKKRTVVSGGEPSGFKTSPIDEWVHSVAASFGGTVRSSNRGPVIHVTSPNWAERNLPSEPSLIAYEPDPAQWVTRTRIVNNMAARVLVSDPVCFTAEVAASAKSGKLKPNKNLDVLRCTIGFSTATYPLQLWRNTLYHVMPSNRMFAIDGDDRLLFRSDLAEKQWKFDKSLDGRLDQIFNAIRRRQDGFMKPDMMTNAIAERQSKLETQIRELEAFYFGGSPGMVDLHGVGDPTISKERAVEAEYRNRLRSVIRRHTLVILVRILSVGRVLCAVGKKPDTLPFVSQPLFEI